MSLVKFNRRNLNTVPYFNDVFDSLFNDSYQRKYSSAYTPSVNIAETANSYELELVVPGWKKEDFKIAIKNGQLTVGAEHKAEQVEENKNFSRREFELRTFERSFVLPDDVNEDEVLATYVNGVLQISISKKELVKDLPKEIAVA
jgi:HSP20 family protein